MSTWPEMEHICDILKDYSVGRLQRIYEAMWFSDAVIFALIMKNKYNRDVAT